MTDYKALSDNMLVGLMKSGKTGALSELYYRYNKPAFAYLVKLVKVPQLAEDLLHDVFLKVWGIREKLDIHTSFSAYLYRSCHNTAINTIKKAITDRSLREQMMAHMGNQIGEQHPLDKTFARYDQLVEQALAQLPPQRRKIFTLVRQQGKTYNEVADELGISVNTVKDHLQKAVRTLKKFVANTGEGVIVIIILENIF